MVSLEQHKLAPVELPPELFALLDRLATIGQRMREREAAVETRDDVAATVTKNGGANPSTEERRDEDE